MSTTVALRATQSAPAAPIDINCRYSNSAIGDSADFMCLGLTTTSASPATFSALAAHVGLPAGGIQDVLWDTASETLNVGYQGAVNTSFSDLFNLARLQRIDSNFVVGRYLWFLSFASGTPAGGDVPTHIAGPYHIL